MITKRKTKTSAPKQAWDRLMTEAKTGDDALARTPLCPTTRAAMTINAYSTTDGNLDLTGLAKELASQVKAAKAGDLTHAEAMLIAQAHTLDAIFNHLAIKANNTVLLNSFDCYLKLALRAQSQCRATWDTLATVKNPPMVGYVKQANIAQGPQQVNNAVAPAHAGPSALENETLQNELFEHKHGERLVYRAKSQASGTHRAMAAVGAIDRPKNTGG
jgi:O6-methylguanine-DNA--protein-cysteine methyltransferase